MSCAPRNFLLAGRVKQGIYASQFSGSLPSTNLMLGSLPHIIAGSDEMLRVHTDEEIKLALKDSRAVLLDVRSPKEWQANGLQRSLNLLPNRILQSAGLLPTDKEAPVIAYCNGGNQVKKALIFLHELGYSQLYNASSATRIAALVKAEES